MGSLMGLGSSTKLAVGIISDSGATTGKATQQKSLVPLGALNQVEGQGVVTQRVQV